MKQITVSLEFLLSICVKAQDSTKQLPFTFNGFVEAYYSYDFNKPPDNNRPYFFYSHNRHNEFNVNLAYIKGSYTTDRTRANFAIATGTYMNANYAAESGVLKNIYEADAGVKISKKKNIWVDAGILPSHIGFESAHSPDCWILTRSIIADNSPYFEAGAKITYTTDNNQWLVSALALNGWQRIQKVQGNSLMSRGTQVQFKPSEKTTINYSTFLGTDKPDSMRQWRYLHNVYGIFQLSGKWGLIADFDLGQEQKVKGSSDLNTWYGSAIILRYAPNSSWALALRAEYYNDENGIIIPTVSSGGFKTSGVSFNVDRIINGNFLWRTELRTLRSKDEIFTKGTNFVDYNTALTASIAISF